MPLSHVIQFRVSDKDLAAITKAAESNGLSVSAWARMLLLSVASPKTSTNDPAPPTDGATDDTR